jgi:hypothetical protein
MLQNKLQRLFLGCVVNAHIGPNPIILNQGEVFIKDKDFGFLLQNMNDGCKKMFYSNYCQTFCGLHSIMFVIG